jgi:hypothetical protein
LDERKEAGPVDETVLVWSDRKLQGTSTERKWGGWLACSKWVDKKVLRLVVSKVPREVVEKAVD